ncbi:flagellar hook assembly protein FlgD [Thermovibrio ammonificans]|jgi:flagellar basal-body rod modification protein FlgD
MALDGITASLNTDSNVKVVGPDYDNSKMSKEDFLKVLLANLQWQDPLQAEDISQFIDDSVKLREMEALNDFENSVDKMVSTLNSLSLFYASGFIGKLILYKGNQTYVENGKGYVSFTLPSDAASVTVEVLDQNGNVVEEKELTNLSAGTYPFEIDNPDLPDGYYTVYVTAKDANGNSIDVTVESRALVQSVVKGDDGKVYIKTAVSEIPLDEIIGIGG